jgi:polyisoprenoid-binding protein YceI
MTRSLIFAAAIAVAALSGCATSTPVVPPAPADAPAVADTAIKSPSGEYAIDPLHTAVVWRVQHMGLALYTARFDKISGALTLDGAAPSKSKISISIDVASVDTPLPQAAMKAKFDADIAKNLGVEKTPNITFQSTSLVRTGPQTGRMTGDLTMNGVTKPATFDVILRGEGVNTLTQKNSIGVQAHATIKRSDWGVTFASLFAADDVDIQVDAELDRK